MEYNLVVIALAALVSDGYFVGLSHQFIRRV
jgi:hypothetical protein